MRPGPSYGWDWRALCAIILAQSVTKGRIRLKRLLDCYFLFSCLASTRMPRSWPLSRCLLFARIYGAHLLLPCSAFSAPYCFVTSAEFLKLMYSSTHVCGRLYSIPLRAILARSVDGQLFSALLSRHQDTCFASRFVSLTFYITHYDILLLL